MERWFTTTLTIEQQRPFRELYSTYEANYEKAIHTCQRARSYPKFTKFIEVRSIHSSCWTGTSCWQGWYEKKCHKDERAHGLHIEGHLIRPIGRICRYTLLLSGLLKYTRAAHPDYKELIHTKKKFDKLLQDINDRRRSEERIAQLQRIQDSIEGLPLVSVE